MTEFINSVITANKEIYSLIKKEDDLKTPQSKGFGGDISIDLDLKAEEIFINYLSKYGKIFSEECGEVGSGKEIIYIDPLDGSDNFKSNFPYYGTAVAIKDKVAITVNLANGDIFIKTKSFFKRGKLFEKDFFDVKTNPFSSVGLFEKGYSSKLVKKLQKNGIKYRVPGAVAISLAYAHDVDFVLFDAKRREFDVVGGEFMCEDLNIYKSDEILLISKDHKIFENIKIVLELPLSK